MRHQALGGGRAVQPQARERAQREARAPSGRVIIRVIVRDRDGVRAVVMVRAMVKAGFRARVRVGFGSGSESVRVGVKSGPDPDPDRNPDPNPRPTSS